MANSPLLPPSSPLSCSLFCFSLFFSFSYSLYLSLLLCLSSSPSLSLSLIIIGHIPSGLGEHWGLQALVCGSSRLFVSFSYCLTDCPPPLNNVLMHSQISLFKVTFMFEAFNRCSYPEWLITSATVVSNSSITNNVARSKNEEYWGQIHSAQSITWEE